MVAYARRHRLLNLFKGKTPRRSIQAAVWKDIHGRRDSPFVMVGPGRVTRRYWAKREVLRSHKRLIVLREGKELRAEWR